MNNEELLKLGRCVRTIRECHQLTQQDVAKKAGLDRNYIGMVERGERNPSFLSLLKIATGLSVHPSQLFN